MLGKWCWRENYRSKAYHKKYQGNQPYFRIYIVVLWNRIITWCVILYKKALSNIKMKKAFTFYRLFYFCCHCIAQPSDFIVLKKNHRTVKSFFAGSRYRFKTVNGYYAGQITSINNDSLFINQYDIRQMPTNLGVYILDTVLLTRLVFNYKDIIKIENLKKGFNWAASGGSLFGGGILLTTVGLGTWIFTKPGTRYHASPTLVAGSAVLAGVGYCCYDQMDHIMTLVKNTSLNI